MTKKIALAEASEAQLRAFAEAHLGISLAQNAKIEALRAKVAQAWGKDEIVVEDEKLEPSRAGDAPIPITAAQQRPAGKVRVIIATNDEAGGNDRVPLSVNGRAMLVERGKPQDLPPEYFEVLRNAVRQIYDPLPGGGMGPPRDVPMYPYQMVA